MSLYLVKQQPVVVGGLAASFNDFARSKRLADGLKETIQMLNNYSVSVGNPPLDGLAGELYGKPIDAKLLAGFGIGRIFVIPARQSLSPSTLGAIEMCPEVASSVGIVNCGSYICELVHFDNSSAAATLKVVATCDAIHPVPQNYEPEPEVLDKGLFWKLSLSGGFEGKLFVGGPDLVTWLESLGRSPVPIVAPTPGNLPTAGVAPAAGASGGAGMPAPLVPPLPGKLGYTTNLDSDGRLWRSSSWERYQTDYASRVNLIRSAGRERYKFIAGEFVVKVDHDVWTNKLMAYEHVSPCPEWANTIGYLPAVKVLNIFGKEELFFSGECSRIDYSLISWEQFIPKGTLFDRKGSFNSLSIALEGFRVSCVFYYGRAWENVGRVFKMRMESGDLVPYLPEYVNYLAHAALLHYFSVVTTSTEQPDFTFESDAAGPRNFDKCLEDGVTRARLEDANYWTRYTAILKDEIRYGIHPGGKRKVEDSGKSEGKGTQAKRPGLITPAVKPFVLGQKEFVCWAALAEKWSLKLDRTAPKWQKPCLGKPKCKNVHIDFNRLPSKEGFLDNLHYCRTLTSKDISVLNREVLALY
jgi:hypothetical protein